MTKTHDFEACPVVLDIDGTVCENGHRVDWNNPASLKRLCRPYQKAQARIKAMAADGWLPAFATARASAMLGVTCEQLRLWFGADVADKADVFMLPWATTEGATLAELGPWAVHSKAEALRAVAGPEGCIMIGDNLWDLRAAALASARFMWAHEWRDGRPLADAVCAMTLMEAVDPAEAAALRVVA